jgi:hypothetical protein
MGPIDRPSSNQHRFPTVEADAYVATDMPRTVHIRRRHRNHCRNILQLQTLLFLFPSDVFVGIAWRQPKFYKSERLILAIWAEDKLRHRFALNRFMPHPLWKKWRVMGDLWSDNIWKLINLLNSEFKKKSEAYWLIHMSSKN